MLRVALIQRFLPSRSRGGVGHFTHGLAQALTERGHDVTVFSQDPAPDGAGYRVEHVVVRDSRWSPFVFPWALRRCDFSDFDVIHAQGDEQWVTRRGRPPVVRTMHGTALAEAWFNGVRAGSPKRFLLHLYFYAMELLADLRADRVIAVSSGTGRYYPRMHAVIPNGIDVAVDKQTHLVVTGVDLQLVGQVAANMRRLRKPDPYKQKGVRYTGEVLKKKVGKTGA